MALRLPAILVDSPSLGGDEVDYHGLAVRLAGGQGSVDAAGQPTAWRAPGLPLLLAALYTAAGEDVVTARAALATLTSATAAATYALVQALTGARATAFLAGLAWALLPTSRALAGALLGEPVAALLVTLALVAVIAAGTRDSPVFAILAGALLGYAILTRAYLALTLVGPAIWLARRLGFPLALLFLLAPAILLGTWAARNWAVLGAPLLTTQTFELWQGNNAWARGSWPGDVSVQLAYLEQRYPELAAMPELDRSRVYVREAMTEVLSQPSRFLWLLPRKALLFLSPASYLGFDWLYAGVAPLALLGTAALALDRTRRSLLWVLGLPVVSVLVVCLVTFGDPRFRHPVDPVIITLATLGLHTVRRSRWPRRPDAGRAATMPTAPNVVQDGAALHEQAR